MNISPFINALTERLNNHKKESCLDYFDHYEVDATEGQKFFKVYRKEVRADGSAPYRSIVAFINKTTGDVLKPASFNAPAKGARGNVLSPEKGMEAITPEGFVRYLKGY